MKSLFTPKDISLIMEKYPSNGPEYCASLLDKPLHQVKLKIAKLRQSHRLKLNDDVYKKRLGHRKGIIKTEANTFHVNPNVFIKPQTKEAAYILGLIWADGFVYKHGYQHKIVIEMIEEDLKHLVPVLLSTGKWKVSRRIRINRKPQLTIFTNNRPLVDFLLTNNYGSKSGGSASNILSIIPKDLQHYWFRGLIDGDGCFYINSKEHLHQFSISSTYDQDWSYIVPYFEKLNIRYSISRMTQKCQSGNSGKASSIRITNKEGIKKFGSYIYQNFEKDHIGLSRKFKKFKIIYDDLPIT